VSGGERRNADAPLVAALAGGATVRDAAVEVGIGEATAHRRLKEPEFRKRVDDARAELIVAAVARLGAASTRAVMTLEGLLAADSEAVRLGAAKAILDAALRWREHQDLTERVRVLEEQLGQDGSTRRWAG
jgi:hypothetical protein